GFIEPSGEVVARHWMIHPGRVGLWEAQGVFYSEPAVGERAVGRRPLARQPAELAFLRGRQRQTQRRADVLGDVFQNFLVLSLDPETRDFDPRQALRLTGDSAAAGGVFQANRESFDAEDMEHHVDLLNGELLALAHESRLLRKHVEVEPQAVPSDDREA